MSNGLLARVTQWAPSLMRMTMRCEKSLASASASSASASAAMRELAPETRDG